jgi:predicted MPP superfamily phosphohydrolase
MKRQKEMKNDTIVALNTLEIDLLINILDEVVSSQKIPEVITEEIRQELFAELDIAKILTDLKEKLGKEKFEQLEDLVEEEQNEVRTYAIKFSDNDIDYLRQGDYSEIETVVEDILEQIKQQEA